MSLVDSLAAISLSRTGSSVQIEAIRQRLRDEGAKSCHEERLLLAWAPAIPIATRHRRVEDFLPPPLPSALPVLSADLEGLRLRAGHPGADGSARLLVALADGQSVEAALLPGAGLCVSTQVGCAVGCVFCMTGRNGLQRQLGSAEIVAQVALARSWRVVTRVVFMGMGEPAGNLDNVLEAIDLLAPSGPSATRIWSSPAWALTGFSSVFHWGGSSRPGHLPAQHQGGPACPTAAQGAPHRSPGAG